MFTAWQACGGPVGMGVFQDRGSQVPEADVINNISRAGDYPGGLLSRDKPGELYGDYVFGRMMKTSVRYTDDIVDIGHGKPRPDYQAWASRYPTYEKLVEAALATIPGASIEVIPEEAE